MLATCHAWEFKSSLATQNVVIVADLSQVLRCFTCCVHGALRCLLNIFEELRLGGARVTQQQHVDVATQPVRPARRLFLHTSGRQDDGGACADQGMLRTSFVQQQHVTSRR